MSTQADIFDGSQLGLDLGDSSAAIPISPQAVRMQLNALIEQVKACQDQPPWDLDMERHHQWSFPQMAKFLPPEEATFLSRQFEFEVAKLRMRATR